VVLATVLHDTIEDTPTTEEELCGQFGDRVATLVKLVSYPFTSEMTIHDKLSIKADVLADIRRGPVEVRLLKCADLLDQMRNWRLLPRESEFRAKLLRFLEQAQAYALPLAEETGLIQMIANWVKDLSGGNLTTAIILVLWVSAIASAFIDNIPFTATMLPIIAFLNQTIPGAESGVLWWSLALGACLGGNGTMIGASANVVTVGLAEKAGYHISFITYMKACWWPMMITVAIAMVYLLIAY